MRIKFDRIDKFIRIYDGTKYLVLLGPEKYDDIYNIIRYPVSLENCITYVFSHYFAEIKVDSYNSLPIEKRLPLHNVIIVIKSVLNKEKKKNRNTVRIFLEKCSYQLAKNNHKILFIV